MELTVERIARLVGALLLTATMKVKVSLWMFNWMSNTLSRGGFSLSRSSCFTSSAL